METPVKVVLFDADGILQHPHTGWVEALDNAGGPGFATAVFEAEDAAMVGRRPFRKVLGEVVASSGTDTTTEQLLALWEAFDVDADAWQVVRDVREVGVLTALATNQQDHRAELMRGPIGYDGLTDRAYYSCEVGYAKPDPAFFEHMLRDLDIAPANALFIDDMPGNVQTARDLGLHAVLHDPTSGASTLRDELAAYIPGLV